MEKLREYLNQLTPEQQSLFAKRCGTSIGYLRKSISTGGKLSSKLCVAIHRESDGAVTRQDLRDDWRDLWPELSYMDSAIDRRVISDRRTSRRKSKK